MKFTQSNLFSLLANNIILGTIIINNKTIPKMYINNTGKYVGINPNLLTSFDITQNWSFIIRGIITSGISFNFNLYINSNNQVQTISDATYRRFTLYTTGGNSDIFIWTDGSGFSNLNVTFPTNYNGSFYTMPQSNYNNFTSQLANGYYLICTYIGSTGLLTFSFYDLDSNLLLSINMNISLVNSNYFFPPTSVSSNDPLYGGYVLNLINTNISISDWNNANFL